jgi:rSAM/selenodomain-associated transferase 2
MALELSVVVPVRNESSALPDWLKAVSIEGFHEIIFVDGASEDETRDLLARWTQDHAPLGKVRCIECQPGRARQMNAGARLATGDAIVFLHADTVLPLDAKEAITRAIGNGFLWGRFDVRLSGRHFLFRAVELFMNWRSALTGIATGDQAMFVRRDVFRVAGGYADVTLMEDVELCRRLKNFGKPARITERVVTSSRRWERRGIVRTILLMWALRFSYWVGVCPRTLARWYGTVK